MRSLLHCHSVLYYSVCVDGQGLVLKVKEIVFLLSGTYTCKYMYVYILIAGMSVSMECVQTIVVWCVAGISSDV